MFSQAAGRASAGSAAAQAHSDVGAVRLRQGLEGRLSHRSGIGGTPFEGGSLRETAANGRFRTLGNGVRDGILAPWHIRAGL
jgi:hypothetical protein